MQIQRVDQQKDAWFDFCVSCASYIAPLLTIYNINININIVNRLTMGIFCPQNFVKFVFAEFKNFHNGMLFIAQKREKLQDFWFWNWFSCAFCLL